eukprot:CAMPEP_0115686362 /NCGR_PEP_ID=MMETSP0272-20121206/59926_1 /TAXON_ID=71861 /ORGANISM="Scrippsiella trochoidea, Strain CCMP3099" /LENGTH=84 /DNA_ID=CAMNT_0003125957 /DNA_START=345 /DNA_END=595 /DNA_ORIENTATION=-
MQSACQREAASPSESPHEGSWVRRTARVAQVRLWARQGVAPRLHAGLPAAQQRRSGCVTPETCAASAVNRQRTRPAWAVERRML